MCCSHLVDNVPTCLFGVKRYQWVLGTAAVTCKYDEHLPVQAKEGMGLGTHPGYWSTCMTGVTWHSSPVLLSSPPSDLHPTSRTSTTGQTTWASANHQGERQAYEAVLKSTGSTRRRESVNSNKLLCHLSPFSLNKLYRRWMWVEFSVTNVMREGHLVTFHKIQMIKGVKMIKALNTGRLGFTLPQLKVTSHKPI